MDKHHLTQLEQLVEQLIQQNQALKEEHPMQTAPKTEDDKEVTGKENNDPLTLTCADIVKKDPKRQGLSPLVMGCAESHPDTGYRVADFCQKCEH